MEWRKALGHHPDFQIVYVTPNWICDQKLYAQYRKQLAMPEAARWTKCTAWVGERTKHHDGASRPSSAHELCSRYTFTAAGSELMAERIRIAARAAGGVPVLDANSITRTGGGCNATEDARHYPKLVPEQERMLRRLLL